MQLPSAILLIRHSKYSAILSNYTPTDCFFGDFAHWDVGTSIHNSVVQRMSFSWASMEQNLHGVILIAGVQERTHYIVQLVHKLRKIVGIQCN